MKHAKKRISILLIVVILSGLFGIAGVNAQESNNFAFLNESLLTGTQSTAFGATVTKPGITPDKPMNNPVTNVNPNRFKKVYPYAHLEEPAKLEGLDYKLKDNVEFMPADATYNIEAAPVESFQDTGTAAPGTSLPGVSLPKPQINLTAKTYEPGTDLLKFQNRSFIPQKNKIYIDGNTQTSYKVIDDATSGTAGVEVPVTKPRASDVFESIYIPRQEISLTKGNITDMTEGVTLVNQTDSSVSYVTADASKSLGDPPATVCELPAPDQSKKYHEFKIPTMVLFEYPSKPGSKVTETEQPKGKDNEPTKKPTPTPHPEEREEAAGTSNSESMSISVTLKGGNIRVYEPTLVCEADWDGEFDLGFRSMKVESEVTVESKITFEKEMCVRIYGYGVDYDSGTEILGRRIAAHIGVGIYAVIGVNGEITIAAKIEQVGEIDGGVTGNFWGFLLGVPSGWPYADYDKEKFETSILLNGKIHAWAYVGPQLTLDVLDFNLLTAQVWLGLEADALIQGEASTENGVSLQLDLSADFVTLFRAWLLNKPFEYYLLQLRIFEKTFQYQSGAMVGEDSAEEKEITPVIQVDGACAFRDTLWGSVWYEDELAGQTLLPNIPVIIKIIRDGRESVTQETTDMNGQFVFKPESNAGLRPTDKITISINHIITDDQTNKITTYKAQTLVPISPVIPFKPFVLEADGFNDIVSGTISTSVPCPGYPDEVNYEGFLNVTVLDGDGTLIRRNQVFVSDGKFSTEFADTMDLSGGHTVYASINYEGAINASDFVDVNLNNLNLIVDCFADGTDASLIDDLYKDRTGTHGTMIENIYAEGTITNLKNRRPFEGNIHMWVGYPLGGGGWETDIPLDLHMRSLTSSSVSEPVNMTVADINKPTVGLPKDLHPTGPDINITEDQLNDLLLPVSTFSQELGTDVLGKKGRFVTGITFTIEHEGLIKQVIYRFDYDDPDIVEGLNNPIDQFFNDEIHSKVNWPDVMMTVGQSQMRVNGVERTIDGRGNTSVMVVGGNVFVPVEAVVTALGGSVTYGSDQKLGIKLNKFSVDSWNGKTALTVNGDQKSMQMTPYMASNGTMMFPVSFLSENLGLRTEWSPETCLLQQNGLKNTR